MVHGVEIVAFVSSVGKVHMPSAVGSPSQAASDDDDAVEEALSPEFVALLKNVTREQVDGHPTRCPHPETAERMVKVRTVFDRVDNHKEMLNPLPQRIIRAKEASDSIGGTVTCVVRGVPLGLGEPVFDKLEAKLAHAMLSIPATKAFEIGSGFRGTEIPGSRHNDAFVTKSDGSMGTKTNWSGGIQGGISNGEDIYFRCVACRLPRRDLHQVSDVMGRRIGFKSPATISQAQETAQYDGTPGTLAARGRHDPCVVPRAVPIVEAMAALVIMDQLLIQNARKTAATLLPPITTLPPTMVKPGTQSVKEGTQ